MGPTKNRPNKLVCSKSNYRFVPGPFLGGLMRWVRRVLLWPNQGVSLHLRDMNLTLLLFIHSCHPSLPPSLPHCVLGDRKALECRGGQAVWLSGLARLGLIATGGQSSGRWEASRTHSWCHLSNVPMQSSERKETWALLPSIQYNIQEKFTTMIYFDRSLTHWTWTYLLCIHRGAASPLIWQRYD